MNKLPVITPEDLMGIALVLAPVLGLSTEKFLEDISAALYNNRRVAWDSLGISVDTRKRTMAYKEENDLGQNSYLSQDEEDFIFRQEAVYQLELTVKRILRHKQRPLEICIIGMSDINERGYSGDSTTGDDDE